MEFHHLGWAVFSIEKAKAHFCAIGFVEEHAPIIDTLRNVRIAFLKNTVLSIEIIEPLSEKSPITKLLEKNGPSPYHACFVAKMESKADVTKFLKSKGFMPVSNAEPAPAIEGEKVQFFYSKEIGLIEIVYEGMQKNEL